MKSSSAATAKTSILIKPSPIPLLSIVRCLRRGAFLLAMVDLSTILCEVLIVALANVPFSSANTLVAFKVCVNIAVAVLVVMLLTLGGVFFSISRLGGGADVPKSLAGKMKLLVGSQMVERFKGLGDLSEKERDEAIEGFGGRYAMGHVRGVDGVSKLGVDFEEFVDKTS